MATVRERLMDDTDKIMWIPVDPDGLARALSRCESYGQRAVLGALYALWQKRQRKAQTPSWEFTASLAQIARQLGMDPRRSKSSTKRILDELVSCNVVQILSRNAKGLPLLSLELSLRSYSLCERSDDRSHHANDAPSDRAHGANDQGPDRAYRANDQGGSSCSPCERSLEVSSVLRTDKTRLPERDAAAASLADRGPAAAAAGTEGERTLGVRDILGAVHASLLHADHTTRHKNGLTRSAWSRLSDEGREDINAERAAKGRQPLTDVLVHGNGHPVTEGRPA